MSQGGGGKVAAAPINPLELAVGILVVGLVFCTLLAVAWRSGAFERMMQKQYIAVTWFHSIGSLKEKEQVVYQGFPIGEVASIDFDAKERLIRVTMRLNTDFHLPPRALANVTSASVSALSSYIELITDFTYIDTAQMVRGDPTIRDSGGVVLIDAIDPMNTGMILTQGSASLASMDAQLQSSLSAANSYFSGWEQALVGSAARARAHSGAAEARAMTAKAAVAVQSAEGKLARGATYARDADRWTCEHEDTIIQTIERADVTTSGAATWTRDFVRNPALMKDR